MQPLVSIIIPTYNRAHLISETLDSVLAQTYPNWECIVVDDGSIDSSITVIQKYLELDSRFVYFSRPVNKKKGPSSCRNFGLEKANGEYIIFLDSDDLLADFCLKKRIEFALANLDYDFWIFKTELFVQEISDLNIIFNIKLENYSDKIYMDLLLRGLYPFCVSSVFWKEEMIKSLNGFDEEMFILEDPELHIKAFKNNLKSFTCISFKSDNFYRKGIESNSINKDKLLKNTYHLFNLYLKDYPQQMRFYCVDFIRTELLLKHNLKYVCKFYLLCLCCGIINFKQKILLPILIFYIVLKIDTVKGLGFYTLTQKYFKQ